MSDAPETPEAAPAAPVAKPPNPLVLVVAVVGALVAGVALGGLIVGPRVVAARSAAAAAAPAPPKNESEHSPVVKIDNVIVNPAGSQGLHFLMVSIAIEVPGARQQELLHAREAELRDIAVSILQKQTLESLDKPGVRDDVKREVLAAVAPMLGSTQGVRIFIPQFVVQ